MNSNEKTPTAPSCKMLASKKTNILIEKANFIEKRTLDNEKP